MSDVTRLAKEWTTHMPVLIKTVQSTKGTVLELGSGLFSTPLLHWLLCPDRRLLITYENEQKYVDFAYKFKSRHHKIKLVTDWYQLELKDRFSVIFLDEGPAETRSDLAIKFKNNADYLVMHDTSSPKPYGWEKMWKHFKYRYDYKFCYPWTSVVSNFKDPSKLFK